ncbi:MAG: hypothetical protein LBU11_03005 [Zoogloeaceae bacterium]|jgi:RecJ-like exonuclease|nr:hypothetical protein [Zoogloeaceae bacterium]
MKGDWISVVLLVALFIPLVIAIAGAAFFALKNKAHTETAPDQNASAAASPDTETSASGYSLMEIARIISNGDTEVIRDITECVADPRAYYLKHHDDDGEMEWTDEEGISFSVQEGWEEECWQELADALQRGKYAWLIDWKGEPEEILDILQRVADQSGFKVVMNDLAVQGDRAQTQPLEPVLHDIAKLLAEKGIVLGTVDIDGDCYVLFLTRPPQKHKLAELAQSIGRRITFEFQGN